MPRCTPSHIRIFFGPSDNHDVRLLRAFGRTEPVLFVYPSGAGAKWCLAELLKLGAKRPMTRWPWGVFFLIEDRAVIDQVRAVVERTMRILVDPPGNQSSRDLAADVLEAFADEDLSHVEVPSYE